MTEKTERMFIGFLFLILAYEWLVSGANKLFSGTFVAQLHHQMLQTIPNMQYTFYGRLLQRYCMAHCEILAGLVEAGELFTGLAFVAVAVAMFRKISHPAVYRIGMIAAVLGAFMNLNFFFYQGGAVFLNLGDPFDEGISIDLLLVLVQICAAIFLARVGASRSQQVRHTGAQM